MGPADFVKDVRGRIHSCRALYHYTLVQAELDVQTLLVLLHWQHVCWRLFWADCVRDVGVIRSVSCPEPGPVG